MVAASNVIAVHLSIHPSSKKENVGCHMGESVEMGASTLGSLWLAPAIVFYIWRPRQGCSITPLPCYTIIDGVWKDA